MPPPKNIDGDDLANLLARAKADPAFRNRLINEPGPLLGELGLGPQGKWSAYFKKLTPENFESFVIDKIDTDPAGEAEAEAEAEA